MITIRKLETAEFSEWNALVESARAGTVYHDARWLVPVSEAAGDTLAIYGLFDDGALVGGIPTQVRKRGPLSLARRAFATPYAGLLVRDDLPAALHDALRNALDAFSSRFSRTTLTFSPYLSDPSIVPSWPRSEQATYLLNFSSIGGLWRSLASEVRNRIRKAEKMGIAATEEFDPAGFFNLFRDLFAQKGHDVPLCESRFAQFVQRLEEHAIARKFMAVTREGEACAACLILHDRHRAYYSLAASHPQLRATGAPSLLVWEVLRSYEGQLRQFDFGGANVPTVAQFKSKFRGRRVTYPEVSRYRSLPEKMLIGLHARFRERRKASAHD